LAWFPEKCFPEKFGRKTLSESCEKFRNIILFADYIKFGLQIFDCYIYFEIYFFKKNYFLANKQSRENTIWTPKGRYHVKLPFTVVEMVAMQVFSTAHGSLKL